MSTQPKSFITPEQYLEIERAAECKSEYFNGEMFAMAGAVRTHNLLVTNAVAELRQQLRGRPCEVYPSDMRVRVSSTGLYTYPDALVVCGEPVFLDRREDTLLNPALIVEVLSPSTEAYDRGRKFEHYQKIDSLRYYLLISSDRVHADLFTLQDGRWGLTPASGLDDTLELESIGCRLKLADLYEKVEFEPAPLRAQNV
ncbi:MAG TPA: Uma2 family endonuclease [Bryobacteraceae bacterium]|nr:Uma2 family endonuclease [Bryobacteraceae bacterium]